jgi:multiple antibiotic resistance protein
MPWSNLPQLIILFAVIFDPLASLAIFINASLSMKPKQRRLMAIYAVMVAAILSFSVLVLGEGLLKLFSTSIAEFKIAGGIILTILGIKMALGQPLSQMHEVTDNSAMAVAAIIGTPLLTGPAAITAIIVSTNDYGRLITGVAIAVVLLITAVIFIQADKIGKSLGKTVIMVMSTVLGLVTIAWGVKFVTNGILAIFF